MTAALEGIRILDMAWLGPGPFCSTLLGDLGAEVIKIYEARPERRGGPVMFIFSNLPDFPGWRNCKTMGLDLKAEEGGQPPDRVCLANRLWARRALPRCRGA